MIFKSTGADSLKASTQHTETDVALYVSFIFAESLVHRYQ